MFKDNKKRLLEILLLAVLAFFTACTNSSTLTPTDVEHETLIVASNGCIFNYNLDDSKIVWEYNSPIDSVGNRNFFVLDGQNIFIPFESGKFINFDINTGKIIWKQQIYGNEGILGMSSDEDTETEVLMSVMPLFMTKPLIDGQNIIMPSTGQPMQAETWLYNFNRTTGEKNWYSSLPTKFNFFTPVKYRNFYFVNSAGFLEKYNMKDGTATSYGMFEGGIKVEGELFHEYEENQFKHPI